MEPLTARQKQILRFITDFSSNSAHMPTIREIAGNFKISIGPVQKHVHALIKKGYIKHSPGISRGIDLAFRKPVTAVPVLGSVRAGIPVEPLEIADDYVYIDKNIAGGGNCFALKVKGDSMTGSGIFEGDIVIIRQQASADDNDIVVATAGEEAAVKKLRRSGREVYLESTNPKYKPIHSKEIKVIGKVIYLSRRVP